MPCIAYMASARAAESPSGDAMHDQSEWRTTLALHKLDSIVRRTFRYLANGRPLTCTYKWLADGSYGSVFKFTVFVNGQQLEAIAKVMFPGPEVCFRTEAEAAAMTFVRYRTRIRVPSIYLHSAASTPVGAPWILMEYIPGECLDAVFPKLSIVQRRDVLAQLAEAQTSLFRIRSKQIGSVDAFHFQLESQANGHVFDGHCRIGPLNDPVLLDDLPLRRCGPFDTELDYLHAYARRCPPPGHLPNAPEVVVDMCEITTPETDNSRSYALSHGDLHPGNIIISPEGKLCILDWGRCAFLPVWAAAEEVDLFDATEDAQRSVIDEDDDKPQPQDYSADSREVQILRAQYRRSIHAACPEYLHYIWVGVEKRSVLKALEGQPGNTQTWLAKYVQYAKRMSEEERQGRYWRDMPTRRFAQFKYEEWLLSSTRRVES
ncbi:kinase-like protein [Calocera viscosa TUFC12733]|uniref:Kinase-like protein n=1 Tax=Calocera viscosa (strain TUFC12733) TaxID=1330018 RepID=A0A167PF75_CALVF|nr:kinase-like protein [Calocera viscosa TUFC12733]